MKGEEKRWKKSEFVLRVMGIISIDPGSLSSTAHPVLAHHPPLFQSLVGIAGFVRSFVRSFELVRAKTHGNSSVYGGKRRIVKCGQARPTDIGERMRE